MVEVRWPDSRWVIRNPDQKNGARRRHAYEDRIARISILARAVPSDRIRWCRLSEALDLVEAVLGELLLVAVPQHAGDELLAEGVDGADMAEGRHGATQAIGLAGREASAVAVS